ncbi:MAG: UPF0158 family protein [Candidatus Eisenbacteria bacterium]
MARHVRVRYDQIRRAYDQGSAEARYFLDVETGETIAVFVELIERGGNQEDARRIASGVNVRYFLVPHKASRDGYAEMEDFIGTVEDRHLRTSLLEALEGKSPFRRFRDILVSYPPEEERWLRERDRRIHDEIDDWLRKHEIVLEDSGDRSEP